LWFTAMLKRVIVGAQGAQKFRVELHILLI
jgi:hypothetical protein